MSVYKTTTTQKDVTTMDEFVLVELLKIKTKGSKLITNNTGYVYFYYLMPEGSKKKFGSKLFHRWVYETFVGEIPDGFQIHHKNEDKMDNRLSNLELVEQSKHARLHSTGKGCFSVPYIYLINTVKSDKKYFLQIACKACRFQKAFSSLDEAIKARNEQLTKAGIEVPK